MKEQADILFIHLLKRSNYIKAHLSEHLDELCGSPLFAGYKKTITATITTLNHQLSKIDEQCQALGITNDSMDECKFIFHLLDNVFTLIQSEENKVPLLSFLDYISLADTLLFQTGKIAEIHQAQLGVPYLSNYSMYFDAPLANLKNELEESLAVA